MHVLATANVNFFASPLNHTILGTICLHFLRFALKQDDAPYRRVGFAIPKWHTRVQKSEKSREDGMLRFPDMDIQTHWFWVGADFSRPRSLAKQGDNSLEASFNRSLKF